MPLAARVSALVLLGSVAAAVLAGCGGSSPTTPTANASAAGNASSAAGGFQAYLSCLSQHGVALPSRGPGARVSRSPGARPNFTRRPRPSGSPGTQRGFGGFGGFGGGFGAFGDPSHPPAGVNAATWSAALTACKSLQPAGRGFTNSQFTAYRNCLQSHGVTFSAGPSRLTTSDPKVAAALKTCAPLRPTPRPQSAAPTPAPSPTG